MASVRGFRGLRYSGKGISGTAAVVCPPYDIISDKQRAEYAAKSEYNVVRLELPCGRDPYNSAAKTLKQWESDGILVREEKDAVYIYEETYQAYGQWRSVKGCIARVKLEEFDKGVILPHEYTLSGAKEDRMKLMKATHCNFSQVYSLYSDESSKTISRLNKLSQSKPSEELTDGDGVTHKLWAVTDEAEIKAIAEDFADRRLYIADGHHRYETALAYRDYCRENGLSKEGDGADYIMMMLVNMEHPELTVFPTHRVVRGLRDFDADRLLRECGQYFEVRPLTDTQSVRDELERLYSQGEKAFCMYSGQNRWTLLVLKSLEPMKELLPSVSDASRGLDVSVLHTLILERLLGIDANNMAKQINLTYVKHIYEAANAVDSGEANCAFILNPTKISEICEVSSAGEKMPQKSTYFYPKLITGLVINKLD